MPGVDIVTVSMDLPFAQKRWCGAFGVDRILPNQIGQIFHKIAVNKRTVPGLKERPVPGIMYLIEIFHDGIRAERFGFRLRQTGGGGNGEKKESTGGGNTFHRKRNVEPMGRKAKAIPCTPCGYPRSKAVT